MNQPASALIRAGALGFAGGLRTFSPLAALRLSGRAFGGSLGRVVLVAAAGELVGDKLPKTPSRLSPPALGARVVSGALAGNAVAGRAGIPIGAGVAVASAFAGARIRQALVEAKGWPDYRCAIVEDAIAATFARLGTISAVGATACASGG